MATPSATASLPPGARLILVDGTCVFCNRVVAFIVRHDPAGLFRFAHLQGDLARGLLERHGRPTDDMDSVQVVVGLGTPNERLCRDGQAAREIWPLLFRLAGVLRFVPLPLLDLGYRWFAKRRYRLFGRYDACFVPTGEERARLVG